MERTFQHLKVVLALYILTLLSCKTNDSKDTKNVFEKALKSDSLSYYFPSILSDTVERENPFFKDFTQRWYSSALYSFKEPILYTKTDLQTIYRLLWLRSFHEPVCFSVKKYNGNYFLNAKALDRQPSFYLNILDYGKDGSGKEVFDTVGKADRFALITFDTIKVLTSEQRNEFENSITKLDFWSSPVADPADGGSTDGSNWILEGRKSGKYHFIDRNTGAGDLIELGKKLIMWSGLKIKDDSFY